MEDKSLPRTPARHAESAHAQHRRGSDLGRAAQKQAGEGRPRPTRRHHHAPLQEQGGLKLLTRMKKTGSKIRR